MKDRSYTILGGILVLALIIDFFVVIRTALSVAE
jgi:hypothetical protein